jgi:O-methyltransferase involved in polyketide biosynthesis
MTAMVDVHGLSPVEQTAFLTAYARALDSRSPRSILGDSLADEVVGKIDYDFGGIGVLPSVAFQTALRGKMLDDRIRTFVAHHPDAVVVDVGAGLDSRLFRVDPPATVDWYSVDLPRVIALRDEVLPSREHAHSVVASVAESNWAEAIPADRPTMLVADGLLAFLTEPIIIGLFRSISEQFTTGEVAFNDYGRIGPLSRLAMKFAPVKIFDTLAVQWAYAGFKDARHPQSWNPRLRLLEEAIMAREPDVSRFPTALRISTRISAHIPPAARRIRILRYEF